MPQPSLKDPILELIRAKEHLDNLDAAIEMFHISDPTKVSIKLNPTSGLKVIEVEIPLPPKGWASSLVMCSLLCAQLSTT
jgi:hypothetical protein